jgi:prepilin-type N-terminal cleavage/methylation domain-containing protein
MNSSQKGFSLVELAIVLVIIGLLLGAALGVGNAQLQAARISSTKQKQEAVKLSLINFISRNNRLPCPAIAGLAVNAVGYGVEAANQGVCTGTVINGLVSSGVVPWRSLGLADETADDGYYHRLTFAVTLTATNTNQKTISGLRGSMSIHTNTVTALGAAPVGNQSNDCTPVGTTYNPCSAVATLVSHGNNGFGAFNKDGAQATAPTGLDETENADNDNAFVIKEYSDAVANPYDDMVMAMTAADLLTPLTSHGTLKDYQAIISDDLSNYESAVIARSIATRTGSSGSYQYDLPLNAPINKIDPWGNNYLYTKKSALSIDSSTPPTDLAFTISSLGPDGVLGGNDDIQNVINVNQLQDAFAKAGW